MQPWIEREIFLQPHRIGAHRIAGEEDQVPAMGRHRAGDRDQRVLREQIVAEGLLSGGRAGGSEPSGVGHGGGVDDVDPGRVGDRDRGHHMRHRVEGGEAGVHGDLDDRGRRVERAIDRAHALAVPAAAGAEGAFAAVPVVAETRPVQPPGDQLARAERRRQRRHT